MQGIEGSFNLTFTLGRIGKYDFDAKLITGSLHLREVATLGAA